MTSTRLAGNHGPRKLNRPLFAVAWVAAFAAAAVSTAQDEEQGVWIGLTAIVAETRVQLGEQNPDATTRDIVQLAMDEPVNVRLFGTDPETLRAVLYSEEARTMIVLNRLGVDLKLDDGTGRVAISLARAPQDEGWVDIYHDADPIIYIYVSGATVGLGRGSVRIEAKADGNTAVIVGTGRAGVLPSDASGGIDVSLIAGRQNTVTISPEGGLSDHGVQEGAGVMMASARGAIIQLSLLPELVQVAERVAEGDIEPPSRGSLVPPAAVAVTVRVRDVTPRGTLATQIIAGSQGIIVQAVPSTAESFLGGNNAALAVVGARLQRTRIIGSPGTAGAAGAPLSVSGELERRFTLGRR